MHIIQYKVHDIKRKIKHTDSFAVLEVGQGVVEEGLILFFVERVINIWNSPPLTVDFSSMATFKQSICCVDFSSFLQYG